MGHGDKARKARKARNGAWNSGQIRLGTRHSGRIRGTGETAIRGQKSAARFFCGSGFQPRSFGLIDFDIFNESTSSLIVEFL
jgi:hypothetical protein